MKRLFVGIVVVALTMIAGIPGPAVSADSLNSLWLTPPVVSGTINYGNPHPSSIRPVADVDLMALGDPDVTGKTGPDRTPTWGQYSLTGFGESPYTVTPSKNGTLNNFINSFDAAMVARHVSGIQLLDSTQQIVADVSGNGLIQSFDAAYIAAFVVNSPRAHGSTGTWIFNPGDRNYPYIISDIDAQDYTALLMGEVSGNWNNNGNGGGGGRSARQSVISAPSLLSASHLISVPVRIESGADKDIIAYQFDLRYDPKVIRPLQNPVSLVSSVSRGLSMAVNATEPGLIKLAVYGALPIERDGLLLNLRFEAVGAAGDISPLTFESPMINEGDPAAVTVNGQITISNSSSNN